MNRPAARNREMTSRTINGPLDAYQRLWTRSHHGVAL
jgi:hypothetical protein